MVINNPKTWARQNKRKFANRLITESRARAGDEPAAFFMAGLPGAGKTEFTKNLIQMLGLNVVRIDMDEIASFIDGYQPEKAHAFREAASDMLSAVFDTATKRRVDFIMDGTFGGGKAIENIKRCNKKGYHTRLIYLHQEPKLAWDFTVDREKVEKRRIDKQGFINSYFAVFNNLDLLREVDIQNFTIDIVVKTADNRTGDWYENVSLADIDGILGQRYNRDQLEKDLKQ